MNTATLTQPQPVKLAWWRNLIIFSLAPYGLLALIVCAVPFDSTRDIASRIGWGLFCAPALLYLGYMLILRPIFYALAITVAVLVSLIPLAIVGFVIGVGVWFAFHIL